MLGLSAPEPDRCQKSLPIRLLLPVLTCFLDVELRNFNDLVLIPLCRPRAGASRREAPATRGAGRAAFPIPRRRARSRRPATERASAVGSDRPQASSVAAARGAIIAAARCHRPGGAPWARPVVIADVEACREVLGAVARGEIVSPLEGQVERSGFTAA